MHVCWNILNVKIKAFFLMIITAISFLFPPKLRWSKNIRRLPTITLSRPSPLVRAGKIAIRVCSITLHCQKYYLPRWRGEFERVMLSLTSPPWPMPKVRATGHRSEGTCSLLSFRRDTDSPANTVASYPRLVTPLLWKRQRGRSSCHHATLLPKTAAEHDPSVERSVAGRHKNGRESD